MIKVRQVKINILKDNREYILKKLSNILKTNVIDYEIIKKSIDARDKDNIKYIYEFDCIVNNEDKVLKKINNKDVLKKIDSKFEFKISGTKSINKRPIIVGAGPSGLFLAYHLSKHGYKPLIIERGEKIENRIKSVNEFFKTNILNTNSNIQFGEGGAGTFSDGKLNTLSRNKDHVEEEVFDIFINCGAPKEIKYDNKPHIGTDILRKVIVNMRNKIIAYGGEFKYNSTLTSIEINNNKVKSIYINNKENILCDDLFLCIGHSARDTYEMLNKNNISMTSKPFAIGVRVIQNQNKINYSMYKDYAKYLKSAPYKVTYKTKNNRSVYSFCMCPGGYVVNASSENNRLAINGMSNYKRDSGYANSAIVITINQDDFGHELFDGLNFQRKLEENAYKIGDGFIPLERYIDYKNNNIPKKLGNIKPMVLGKYKLSNINNIFPNYINDSIKEAMEYFNTKIDYFSEDDVLILGVETRTSSPIRILRDKNYESNVSGIYPIGEGAGYAGGITTAAMDGIRAAQVFASIYKPF